MNHTVVSIFEELYRISTVFHIGNITFKDEGEGCVLTNDDKKQFRQKVWIFNIVRVLSFS